MFRMTAICLDIMMYCRFYLLTQVTQGTYTFLSFNMYTSEKFCLQWNDFKVNATSSFANLREDKDLTDVTLASEDAETRNPKMCFNLKTWGFL